MIFEKIYSGEQTSASATTPSTPVNASAPITAVGSLSLPLTIMDRLLANPKLTNKQRASITQQRNVIAAEEVTKSSIVQGNKMTMTKFENAVRTGIVQGNKMTTTKFENAVKAANTPTASATMKRSHRKRRNRRKTRRN